MSSEYKQKQKNPHKVPSFGIIQLNPLHGENSFSFQMLAARGTRGGISTLYCVTWRALIGPWCLAGCRAAPLKTSPFPHQRRLNPDTLHRLLLLLLLRISHQRLQRWLRSLLGRGRWSPARTLTTTWKQLVGESVFASLPVANCEFTVIYANFFLKPRLTHWFHVGWNFYYLKFIVGIIWSCFDKIQWIIWYKLCKTAALMSFFIFIFSLHYVNCMFNAFWWCCPPALQVWGLRPGRWAIGPSPIW